MEYKNHNGKKMIENAERKFNQKQSEKLSKLIKEFYGKENHTVIEEDLFNLKYIEYNIRYGSLYYRHGFLKTLRKVIKNLEKEGKQ